MAARAEATRREYAVRGRAGLRAGGWTDESEVTNSGPPTRLSPPYGAPGLPERARPREPRVARDRETPRTTTAG